VNLVSFKSFGELLDQIQADLRKGSPFYDAFVFLGQTKSELILCSECDPEQRPLIAPLTELIRNDPALQWNDVAVFQRSTNSAFDGDIYTVPIDGGD
jgi:multiple sugar transport system substrate-binding protein